MTVIDLFAGIGGATYGAVRAGATVIAAVEAHPATALAYRARHPAVALTVGDVASGVASPADVWWASPPCQPWSTAGHRLGASDPRDGYGALVAALGRGPAPRWLLIENVPAAQTPAALADFFPIVESRIVDCADLGVPQSRRRLVTVCGPRAIEWPRRGFPCSAARALGIPVEGHYLVAAGLRADGRPAEGRPRSVDLPAPTVTTRGTMQLIVRGSRKHPWRRVRTLTVAERARLQGIPEGPGLTARTVGNAVPPTLVAALVRAVMRLETT
jgi:site-specific DNA-cytosine methylase